MKMLLPLAIGAALLAAASSAFAITDEEGNASLQFNFSAPGARSLAMGGAFIGLADDATAAFSNPAGLVQIASPEVSMEFRTSDFSTEYAHSGSFTDDPFNTSGVNYAEADSDIRGLSFLSAVLPREDWAVAFYRHEFLNYETAFRSEGIGSIYPFDAAIDASIYSYGLAGAFKLNDQWSFGLSLNAYQLDLDSNTRRFTTVADTVVRFSTQQQGGGTASSASAARLSKTNIRSAPPVASQSGGDFKQDDANQSCPPSFNPPYLTPRCRAGSIGC